MSKKKSCVVLPFVAGFVASLFLGWWGFPQLLYSEKTQPLQFSHKVHVEDQAMSCEDCHFYREDGSYAGLPTTESCASCHEAPMGDDPAEIEFVEKYVNEGDYKEVPWYVYQKQPDNVYFSHIAHDGVDCTACHPDMAFNETLPVYYENRLTKYSKQTMKMWECERCHAENGASNACFVCHK
ncbi:MAG: cytochrome C [Deltaproteobacteria bacterium]|nr:cytochrome C [Deltaproteobacteria bacterium]